MRLDQCKYCILKGDFKECVKQDCGHHDTWYAKQLKSKLEAVEKERDHWKANHDNILKLWNEYRKRPDLKVFELEKENSVLKKGFKDAYKFGLTRDHLQWLDVQDILDKHREGEK